MCTRRHARADTHKSNAHVQPSRSHHTFDTHTRRRTPGNAASRTRVCAEAPRRAKRGSSLCTVGGYWRRWVGVTYGRVDPWHAPYRRAWRRLGAQTDALPARRVVSTRSACRIPRVASGNRPRWCSVTALRGHHRGCSSTRHAVLVLGSTYQQGARETAGTGGLDRGHQPRCVRPNRRLCARARCWSDGRRQRVA
jgi:hypothetical protein